MPQLVKGGKYIFGWTILNDDLRIRIPDETFEEYKFAESGNLIIISGSKTSGGFSIITPDSIINSKLSVPIVGLIGYIKKTDSFTTRKFELVKIDNRLICWTTIESEKYFRLSKEIIDSTGIKAGCKLLVGRGSGLGPAFILKGRIYEEALRHKEIPEFC